MIRIMQLEEIAGHLLLIPDLVRQQEQRAVGFARNAARWLQELETILGSNRLPEAASVAVLRSGLLSAEQGVIPPGIAFRGRPSRKKIRDATASHMMHKAAELATTVLARNQARLGEGEQVAQQVIAVTRSRQLLPHREQTMDNTTYLNTLRHSLAAHTDVENAVVHLESLVGQYDALLLLDRALSVTGALVPRSATPPDPG